MLSALRYQSSTVFSCNFENKTCKEEVIELKRMLIAIDFIDQTATILNRGRNAPEQHSHMLRYLNKLAFTLCTLRSFSST